MTYGNQARKRWTYHYYAWHHGWDDEEQGLGRADTYTHKARSAYLAGHKDRASIGRRLIDMLTERGIV